MKSFIVLFLIAIISCFSNSPILKEKEPIDIIRCIISNQDLINQLKEIILKMEDVIKNKDLSGLVSLLNLFSMVEEVKACFEKNIQEEEPEQEIVDKEPILKEGEVENLVYCIQSFASGFYMDFESSLNDLNNNCIKNLSEETRDEIKKAGKKYFMTICMNALINNLFSTTICQNVASSLF